MDLARRDLIGLDGVRPAAKNARMSRTKALATSGDSSMGLRGISWYRGHQTARLSIPIRLQEK